MLTDSTVLVRSRLGADHIEVRRDTDGTTWLATWSDVAPEQVMGIALAGLEPQRVYGDRWLGAGAMLPAGVQRVQVRVPDGTWLAADTGDGAWSLIVARPAWTDASLLETERHGLRARLLDARGKLVSRATRERLATSRRVGLYQRALQRLFPSGLPIRCPVCRRGRWRVGDDEFGNERIFCAKCGHDERSGWVS